MKVKFVVFLRDGDTCKKIRTSSGYISKVKKATEYQCEECVKAGDTWVHLRTGQECGTTLCCDSSLNKHASKHASSHSHPVISSAEPNENWMWCYVHESIAKH